MREDVSLWRKLNSNEETDARYIISMLQNNAYDIFLERQNICSGFESIKLPGLQVLYYVGIKQYYRYEDVIVCFIWHADLSSQQRDYVLPLIGIS